MKNAKNNELYDFKVTNGEPNTNRKDVLRGSPVIIGKNTIIASARDIGNYVAGYYAGVHGFSWSESRIAFDIYQKAIEGKQTQSAQYMGWEKGSNHFGIIKSFNLVRSIPSIINFIESWKQKE